MCSDRDAVEQFEQRKHEMMERWLEEEANLESHT
jgi:hypothetical protein